MNKYTVQKVGRIQWWISSDVPKTLQPLLDSFLGDPDHVLQSSQIVAQNLLGRKQFYHVRSHAGQPGVFVKVFVCPRGPMSLIRRLQSSRARRKASVVTSIEGRGIRTAAPLAVGEEYLAGRLLRRLSIIPEFPVRDLRALLLDPVTSHNQRRIWVESFGVFTRRLHDLGIDQDDTTPNNFLVTPEGEFIMIDFERCRVGAPLTRRRRWQLLAKLQRHDLGVSRTDRLRFLRAYLAEEEFGSLRQAWKVIADRFLAVRRRDAHRAARRAFQEGRHMVRNGQTWSMRGRENVPFIRVDASAREAKRLWVLALQFERLGLPALWAARLDRSGIDLTYPNPKALDPTDCACDSKLDPVEVRQKIQRARMLFAPYGDWIHEPEWEVTQHGAWLRDLASFRLRIRRPRRLRHRKQR